MERFTEVRRVAAPVATCFTVLTDAGRAHRWLTVVRSVRAEGPPGPGRVLHAAGGHLGVSLTVTQTVDVWEPPTAYGWSGDDPVPVRFRFDLTALEPSATTLSAVVTADVDHRSSMGVRVAVRALRRQFARSTDRLVELVEHEAGSPTRPA